MGRKITKRNKIESSRKCWNIKRWFRAFRWPQM